MGISITDVLGGSALTAVKDIIGQFHLSPDKKAEMQAAVDANAAVLAQKQLEYDEKMADIAGQNIRAETQSEDKFTSRARPGFLWVMNAAIGMALIVIPLINIAMGKNLIFPQIPDSYLQLFGVGFVGYVGGRSWEKVAAIRQK